MIDANLRVVPALTPTLHDIPGHPGWYAVQVRVGLRPSGIRWSGFLIGIADNAVIDLSLGVWIGAYGQQAALREVAERIDAWKAAR